MIFELTSCEGCPVLVFKDSYASWDCIELLYKAFQTNPDQRQRIEGWSMCCFGGYMNALIFETKEQQ